MFESFTIENTLSPAFSLDNNFYVNGSYVSSITEADSTNVSPHNVNNPHDTGYPIGGDNGGYGDPNYQIGDYINFDNTLSPPAHVPAPINVTFRMEFNIPDASASGGTGLIKFASQNKYFNLQIDGTTKKIVRISNI